MFSSTIRIIPLIAVMIYVSACALAQNSDLTTRNTERDSASLSQTPTSSGSRPITISDAVSIFLKQNFQVIAARYDVDTAEAEKLTARLRPNPDISVGFSGLPLNLSGNLLTEQQYSYSIAQPFELGGKRGKRIDVANANSDVARAHFEMAVWQLTNRLKKKFYTGIP